jgi:hypothetical protein
MDKILKKRQDCKKGFCTSEYMILQKAYILLFAPISLNFTQQQNRHFHPSCQDKSVWGQVTSHHYKHTSYSIGNQDRSLQ